MGKTQIAINTASLVDGDSIAAYLTTAAGALATSTTIGAKEHLDTKGPSEKVDGATYTATTDYLTAIAAISSGGAYKPLNLDASGNLKVSGTFSVAGDYAEDSPATSGDIGLSVLLVRQDTLAASTSTDGDYGNFKSTNLGELYVRDASSLAQLVLVNTALGTANGHLAAIETSSGTTATNTGTIVTNTGTIATNTGTTATNTGTIASTLTALSKSEDAAHSSGDQGIQALAVRKDAQGTNVSTDGDYSSLLTWSEGSLKVVDIANSSVKQQQLSVTDTATQLPAAALANRRSIMIQNTGANKIWLGSSTVTSSGATAGIEMAANSFMDLDAGPAVALYAIKVGAAGNNVNILEMA